MCELTILMPCLNEAGTLAVCIQKAQRFLDKNAIEGEILIADNGSTDNSVFIAENAGARVVRVSAQGYGSALGAGIKSARGKYIIMGDADDSYDFQHLTEFVIKLREGFDLVMGNRFKGGIREGAMPFLHRYLGNPVLSFIGRLFFHSSIGDFHCGLRGFNKEKILKLGLVTTGMEFASEIVVKATILNYRIAEVPVILYPDGRSRPPHLNTWRDGWRHLVFLLIYSPKWLFFFPSLILLFLSALALIILLQSNLHIRNVEFGIHTLTLLGSVVVISYQLFLFAVFIRIYSLNQGLFPMKRKHLFFFRIFTLERGILTGLIVLVSGIIMVTMLFNTWAGLHYGQITDLGKSFRILIPSLTLISVGCITIFSSFFLRILGINPTNIQQHEES